MNLKTSPFAIQDKKLRDLDLAKEYPTLKDLMIEQGISTNLADYWDKECELNPSNPRCLEYDDQLNSDLLNLFKTKKSQLVILLADFNDDLNLKI